MTPARLRAWLGAFAGFLAVASGVGACSSAPLPVDEDTYPPGPRTPGIADASVIPRDARPTGDEPGDGGGGGGASVDAKDDAALSEVVVSTDLSCGFGPTSAINGYFLSDDGLYWILEATDGARALSLGIFADFGGPQRPGSGTIGADDETFENCGFCVVLGENCSGRFDDSGLPDCARTFMPRRGGRWTVSQIGRAGGVLEGTLSDIELREVRVDVAASGSAVTRDVQNGGGACLRALTFRAKLDDQ